MDQFELAAEELYRRTEPEDLGFDTTADLEPLEGVAGQPRATEALDLGIGMRHDGFNVFALGDRGSGKRHAVRHFLERRAAERPRPSDWCYVHNFEEAHKPRLLRLTPGCGRDLAADMEDLVRELGTALAAAFESDEYQTRRGALEEEMREHQSEVFREIQEEAEQKGLVTLRTPGGVAFAPKKDGEVMESEEFLGLEDEERREFEEAIQDMQQELQKALRQMPARVREHQEKVRELNEEMTRFAVGPLFEELGERYAEEEDVVAYLEEAEEDVVKNARRFLQGDDEEDGAQAQLAALTGAGEARSLRRYRVNVVVDRADDGAAPIVHEDHPTYANLMGRVEYQARMGALTTDFTLIKPGALHRANGGYLVLEAEKILRQPFAWEALKRALASNRVRIESPGQAMGLLNTVTLEPEPMPLDVKVVLTGSRLLYYLLSHYDSEFGEQFKIAADFDDRLERSPESERLYARLVASMVERGELLPFGADAVARVIEHCARHLGDGERLSTRTRMIDDLVREAEHYARGDGRETVQRDDVQRAVDAQIHRADRAEQRIREEILRETVLIDTEGARVGQVNGLAVLALGGYAFGRPNRITARVRVGKGEVVDIEREVKLSGPIHSKGVMILSSFLAARYAEERTLSLSASLVFEQSYGGIDGDSASVAELTCLLSAIAGVPIRQGIAVTGSVNQHGRVQAIGGVNEKIEGFFKVCAERGLTGYQGVVIPRANAKHLMLDREVVEAVEQGRFHVWAVTTVDEAAGVLTGIESGEPDGEGEYPEGSLNRRVADRLGELAETRRKLAAKTKAAAKALAGEDEEDNEEDGGGDGDDEDDGDDGPPLPPDPEPPAEEGTEDDDDEEEDPG